MTACRSSDGSRRESGVSRHPIGAGLGTPHACNRLISLNHRVTPFRLCPLMRTSRAFRYFRPKLSRARKIPTKSHPVVRSRRPSRRPDLHTARRRAQRRSRMAEGHREAAPRVLDGREHGGSLARRRTTAHNPPHRRLSAGTHRRQQQHIVQARRGAGGGRLPGIRPHKFTSACLSFASRLRRQMPLVPGRHVR